MDKERRLLALKIQIDALEEALIILQMVVCDEIKRAIEDKITELNQRKWRDGGTSD